MPIVEIQKINIDRFPEPAVIGLGCACFPAVYFSAKNDFSKNQHAMQNFDLVGMRNDIDQNAARSAGLIFVRFGDSRQEND